MTFCSVHLPFHLASILGPFAVYSRSICGPFSVRFRVSPLIFSSLKLNVLFALLVPTCYLIVTCLELLL